MTSWAYEQAGRRWNPCALSTAVKNMLNSKYSTNSNISVDLTGGTDEELDLKYIY